MRDGSATKGRIERAALSLFVKRGIAETSIRQIAKAAHVALGAMYNHYRNKEELAEVLFAEQFHRVGSELERLAERGGPVRVRMAELIAHVFTSVERDPLSIPYLIRTRQEYARRVRTGAGNPFLAFRKVIAGAVASGEIPKQDINVSTSMVVGAVNQVVEMYMAGRVKLAEATPGVTAAVLRMIGA